MSFKYISIFRIVCAILVEGFSRNNSLTLVCVWVNGSKGVPVSIYVSLFSSGGHFGQQNKTICAIMVEDFCEFISNLDQWFRRRCLKIFLFLF